ncbi:MAG: NnrS family protein [Phenylobacterium sp.]|uniref:NnrS family protein n=1 Tax=Phenylobacterium sp. TaxID=1871053 RepID=UPI003918B44A
MPTAAARRAYSGPPVFSFGFRPFFLLGALWAAIAVPLWVWSWLGGPVAFAHRDWHVHEMLFGFLAAIVAGFLTTAVPNWTGRMPVIGAPLAGLVALWIAGRAAMLFADGLGPAAAVMDAAFLVVFAGVIWREVLAGRNWRNLPVCGLVTLLALANIGFHLDAALWRTGAGERLALGAIAMLLALIGGRITPSFTRNWMKARRLAPEPAAAGRFDQAALALTGAGVLAWVLLPESRHAGVLLAGAGLANLIRLARWRGWAAAGEPLVWILHLGYAWLGLGLLLLGASKLVELVPPTAGLHALAAGAAGVMTLAVMTRASRGHTGRDLAADRATTAIYLAVNAGAVLRVAAAFAVEAQTPLLAASATLWAMAFGGFALTYGRMLTTPRRVAA